MRKWLYLSLLVFIVVIWQTIYLYNLATTSLKTEQKKAISKAKSQYELTEILDVTYFNGEDPYQVIRAKDKNAEEIIIWVSENEDQKMISRNSESGINKQQVQKFAQSELNIKQLKDIRLGIKKETPVWEITFIDHDHRLSLFYLHFSGETWIENYRLKTT